MGLLNTCTNVGSAVVQEVFNIEASQEERNLNLNEDYFVAKIERKAKKLDEAGMYSAQPYQKNDWIVYVR